MDSETIKKRVHDLKTFYTNLVIYGAVCITSIVVWICVGGGVFWPIWVILGCGLSAFLQAMRLGKCSKIYSLFPFLDPAWEDAQVKEIEKKSEEPLSSSEVEKSEK